MVALAPPDAVSVEGLTVQTGKYWLVMGTTGVTVQVRLTGLLRAPLEAVAATVILVEETSPGTTALGFKGSVVMVKSAAARAGKAPADSTRHRRRVRNFHGDSEGLDFNMSGL